MIDAIAQVHIMHPIRQTVLEKATSLVMVQLSDAIAQVHVMHPTRQAVLEEETFLAMV